MYLIKVVVEVELERKSVLVPTGYHGHGRSVDAPVSHGRLTACCNDLHTWCVDNERVWREINGKLDQEMRWLLITILLPGP